MKKTLQFVLVLLLPVWMSAQECPNYFPLAVGNSWEMTHYDKKDKVDGSNTYSVKSVNTIAGGYEASVTTTSIDNKGEVLGSGDLVLKCANGIFYFDMKNFLDQSTMEQNKDMDVTMSANNLEFPATLTAGATLPDANITYQISSNGMVMMTITVLVTDRKVVGQETITVPAGTFEVWKITSKTQSKTGFINTKISSVDFISLGAGIVKSETYSDKDVLMGYSILTKLVKL